MAFPERKKKFIVNLAWFLLIIGLLFFVAPFWLSSQTEDPNLRSKLPPLHAPESPALLKQSPSLPALYHDESSPKLSSPPSPSLSQLTSPSQPKDIPSPLQSQSRQVSHGGIPEVVISPTVGAFTLKFLSPLTRKPLSFSDFFNYLGGESSDFRFLLSQHLSNSSFSAFFFETPPVRYDLADSLPVEIKIINSRQLNRVSPQPEAFAPYFSRQTCKDSNIVSFRNLRGDALLVSPCPVHLTGDSSSTEDFSHLAKFLRSAPDEMVDQFWKTIGEAGFKELKERFDHNPRQWSWFSTSGLGVFWLHFRIDTEPKYYQTSEYQAPETFYQKLLH